MVWIFGNREGDALSNDVLIFLPRLPLFLSFFMDNNLDSLNPGKSLEGQEYQLANTGERERVIDLAFDYRGDVTMQLQSGESVEGFLYDRDLQAHSPTVKVFPKGQSGALTIKCEDIVVLAFTGEDTAFGKSWDDWVKKMEKVSQK